MPPSLSDPWERGATQPSYNPFHLPAPDGAEPSQALRYLRGDG